MSKKNKQVIEVSLPNGMPIDIPQKMQQHYAGNYYLLTRNTGRLMLFAADQKIEHLNDDFYGPGIHADALDPEHLFKIASASIGGFATHFGLIARYGKNYPKLNYIAKLNAKTNVIPAQERDPMSTMLWSVDEVVACKFDAQVNICGIGVTIYLGSQYEQEMLAAAAHAIARAHAVGLIAIVWIYPRGKFVKDETSPAIIAGATGVAAALGADFVKIHCPHATDELTAEQALSIACIASKRTGVICSGGCKIEPELLLKQVYQQLQNGAVGAAIGRNIFQRSLPEAIALSRAVAALIYERKDLSEAIAIYQSPHAAATEI